MNQSVENWRICLGSSVDGPAIPLEELEMRRHRVMACLVSSQYFDQLEPVPTEEGEPSLGIVVGSTDQRGDIVVRCTEAVADAISQELQQLLAVVDCYHIAYAEESY